MVRGGTGERRRWWSRPAVLLALGVVALTATATVRLSQTTTPEGWVTTDAEAVAAEPGTQRGRHLMRWTPEDGEEWTLSCPIGGHDIGEVVPIAYDPGKPTDYKALVTDRMWLVAVLSGVTALFLLSGLVALASPSAPAIPMVSSRRRQAIL